MKYERYSDQYSVDLHRLVAEFHKETLSHFIPSIEQTFIDTQIDKFKDNMFLAINQRCEGVFAGMEVTAPTSPVKIFQEFMWFMSPEYRAYGIKLYKMAEEELRRQGFTAIVMVSLVGPYTERLCRFYQRLGYEKMEIHFIKHL